MWTYVFIINFSSWDEKYSKSSRRKMRDDDPKNEKKLLQKESTFLWNFPATVDNILS